MKKVFYACLLLMFGHFAKAQSNVAPAGRSIAGTIVDQEKIPLPYVAITLSDSGKKTITTVLADEKGNFKINALPKHPIKMTLSMIGFTSKSIDIPLGDGDIDLKTITLSQDVSQLKEVTVNAGPNISYRLDKKVFQAGRDLIAQSGSATDLLSGVPSVNVSPTGAISLRGNSSVLILVNGRRSGSTQALDQLPADQIDRIEVITNPSSRYEAAGAGGIINIILKKNKKGGFNGQLRVVGGVPNETRINPSINYKSDKVNLFSNFGLRLSDYVGVYHTNRSLAEGGKVSQMLQLQNEQRHDDNQSFYLGADVNINDKTTITAAFLKNAVDDHDQTQLYADYSTVGLGADSSLTRNGESKEKRSYNQLEFNLARNFENQRKKLTLDLQYDFWDSDKSWDLLTQRTFPNAVPLSAIRTSSIGKSKDLSVQTDFALPVDSLHLFEVGVKIENRTVTSDFLAEQQKNSLWEVVENIDNSVAYEEMIAGVYAQFGGKTGKLSYQAGLRTEFTKIDINDRTGSYSDRKNYTRLFPSLNLSYDISANTTLQASYSRRIERPSLNMIYPFNELTDLTTRFIGNPYLNPSFADLLEVGYLHHLKGLTINPSIYVTHRTGLIVDYTYQTENEIFITMPINIKREWRSGAELSVTYDPLKTLQFSAEANIFKFNQVGSYENQNLDFKGESFTARMGCSIKLPKIASFQVRYNLTGARRTAQRRENAMHQIDAGASRNFFADKVSVLFDVSNLFALREYSQTTTGSNYSLSQDGRPNAARYRLALVYRLNLKANQNVRQAKMGNRN